MSALLEGCNAFAELALSSFGPYGRLKALQAAQHTPANVLTSVSGPLFQGIRCAHPVEQLLVSGTVQAQHAQYGDGGLACIYLACRLVQAVLQGAGTRAHIYEACCAVHAVGDRLQDFLAYDESFSESQGGEGIFVPCDSIQQYLALCRSVLNPKLSALLDQSELEHLAALAVEAFVASLPDGEAAAPAAAPAVATRPTVHVLRGGAVADSVVVPGLVLPADELAPAPALDCLLGLPLVGAGADARVGAEGSRDGEGASVELLLFSCDLDTRSNMHAAAVAERAGGIVVEQQGAQLPGQAEEEELEGILAALEEMCTAFPDVRLVICQKGIHPAVQEWLLSREIGPLQRLGAARMSALSLLTGCNPVESLAQLSVSAPGSGRAFAYIQRKEIGGQRVLQAQPGVGGVGPVICRTATLVLGCPTDTLTEHMALAAESALKVLRVTAEQAPVAVKGAGETERALARDLEGWVRDRRGCSALQVTVVKAATQALLDLASKLQGNYNSSRNTAMTQELPGQHTHNANALVLESLLCKQACLKRATAIALQVARLIVA